jgi:DNA-binding transcriptional regulator YhcF (GntR family)
MWIDVQADSGVPIYEQVVSQVIYAIASGGLEAGARIPSVRELAGKLLVNPNTVARAYQKLERLGVVTTRRGLGMEITPEAAQVCKDQRQEIVRERIRLAIQEAVQSALPTKMIRQLVDEELARSNGHP